MIFAVIILQFAVIDLQFAVISLQFAVISLQQQIEPILTYDHTPTLIRNLS